MTRFLRGGPQRLPVANVTTVRASPEDISKEISLHDLLAGGRR
jgi:hypothetical protein